MHKKLLCDTCGFFRAALGGRFLEAQNQAIDMPEDDPGVFCYFQYWAYTGVIEDQPRYQTPWRTVAGIYAFAEARCIPGLQNSAMDLLIRKHEVVNQAPINEYRYIYENTAEKSPVRRFLAEWAAHKGYLAKGWFVDRTIFPIDFTINLSLALYERIETGTSSTLDFWEIRSRYHVEVAGASSERSEPC